VGKAATVSKGSNSFKAFYIYTFNRNVFLEAAMAPLKLSSKEAVVSTIISAISDSSKELSLRTKTTSTPAGNRKHTEKKDRSRSKSFKDTVFICSDTRT
jgi:hypothetical protein